MANLLPTYGPVEIRSSCIVAHNYEIGANERLERMFSVWDKGRHQNKPMGVFYDVKNKDLYLPGGVQLYHVTPSFRRQDIIPRIPADPYDFIGKVQLKKFPKDERQKKAIRFCVGLEEYSKNRNLPQLSLNLHTGVGKTYVAIFTFAFYGIRTIMITSGADWLEQWREELLNHTDLRDDEIYTMAGSGSIFKLLNGIKDPSKIRFYLCTHSTLYSWGKRYGWDAIRQLFIQLRIGIKIYDEAHLYFDNICRIDFFTNCLKNYYLTATPLKSDFHQNKIYQRSFETVPKISLYDEEVDPHTKYLALKFNSRPSAYDIQRIAQATQYGFSIMEYVKYFSGKEYFFKLLHIVMVHCLLEMKPGERILIYIATNEAISLAYRWLRYTYWNLSVGIYTSLVPKAQKREQLDCTCILTTTKSAQVLLNIKNLKKVVLFAEPFNSEPMAIQVMGRARNEDTELIELVDCGFTRIVEWYMHKRNKVYSKYATECNEITYTEYEINDALLEISRQQNQKIEELNRTLPRIADYVKKEGEETK